jgi:tetratricopeptide (TPR) repeat protein
MTRNTTNSFGQPSLEDLMVRFLASRSDAAATAVESGEGDVEPHEVATGFRVDPWTAWNDATSQINAATAPLPPDWATLVNQPASAFAVPMAIGNFPQRVRDLHPLLTRFEPRELRPSGSQSPLPGLPALRSWIANNASTQPLIAAGLARLIGDFDTAEKLLVADDSATANERAALLWHRGESEEALAIWNSMPENPAAMFNRGMALLFLGRTSEARAALTKAVAVLPEMSGWNALGRLYLALSEIHG